MSFRQKLENICANLPGAEWAGDADGAIPSWKIAGKMFACTGTVTPGVSVKTSGVDIARMLIDAGVAEKAKYFHASWVRLPETVEDDELRHRVHASYDIIRRSLPKRLQAELPPWETA
ncbi:MAG: MmcQ/YjbR family DNA-binding protein [Pseudomonadota bacterium]